MEGSYFVVNAYILIVVIYFWYGFITKGNGIKYAVYNGTNIFYIFYLLNQRWCGISVLIGFGFWGNFIRYILIKIFKTNI